METIEFLGIFGDDKRRVYYHNDFEVIHSFAQWLGDMFPVAMPGTTVHGVNVWLYSI
jgi:hypothetical protein